MGARKKSGDAPEEEDVLLCPSCVQPVDAEAHFCPRCNTPLSTIATIDPIMRLRTYGNFMTRFAGRGPAARIGCVLLLILVFLPLCGIPFGIPLVIFAVSASFLSACLWRGSR